MAPNRLFIQELSQRIPNELLHRSGAVFYSGRNAFSAPGPLYVLGLNPGGDPAKHRADTIASHTANVLKKHPDDWSAYRDESWEGKLPGTHGMAPRVLHLFAALGINPGNIPCSNLVFVRSKREEDIKNQLRSLGDRCWPFHEFAIQSRRPRAILCFGTTAGNYLRRKLQANTPIDKFEEINKRRWTSRSFTNAAGLRLIVATHPSVADWTTPPTDPTPLVRNALK